MYVPWAIQKFTLGLFVNWMYFDTLPLWGLSVHLFVTACLSVRWTYVHTLEATGGL